MIIDGPDSSVVLRYIWNTASEEESAGRCLAERGSGA